MTKSIEELIGAFLTSAEELKERISDVENALDRQGVKEMKPGLLVDKEFCSVEHANLVKAMRDLFNEFTKGVTVKIYATWLALVMVLGGMGYAVKLHDAYIHEIMKMVFK